MLLAMVHMSSINLEIDAQQTCLQIAHASIKYGLQHGSALHVVTLDYPKPLQQTLSSFVTLYKYGELRGCIGSLEAYQPLINDIAEHAYSAAFHDPRFSSLKEHEYEKLEIKISVLGQAEVMSFDSEEDLLNQLRPTIDGLILEYKHHRGTFLPSVWDQLMDKQDFLNHLKVKSGLTLHWWDKAVKISRYETFSF